MLGRNVVTTLKSKISTMEFIFEGECENWFCCVTDKIYQTINEIILLKLMQQGECLLMGASQRRRKYGVYKTGRSVRNGGGGSYPRWSALP